MSEQAFPKRRRMRDPKLLASFHRQNPRCAVVSCRKPSMPLPHHVHPNSLGGPGDVEGNLVSLCAVHHIGDQGPHTIGHRTWFQRFENDLDLRDRERVATALQGLPKGMD